MRGLLFAALIFISGCAALPGDAEHAEAYIYPRHRFTPEARYVLAKSERQKAVLESKRMRADLLYEVVVDDAGKVVMIRTVRRWKEDDQDGYITWRFLLRVKKYTFKPDVLKNRHRTFYFPVELKTEKPHYLD